MVTPNELCALRRNTEYLHRIAVTQGPTRLALMLGIDYLTAEILYRQALAGRSAKGESLENDH
jgi:hypothetical protein